MGWIKEQKGSNITQQNKLRSLAGRKIIGLPSSIELQNYPGYQVVTTTKGSINGLQDAMRNLKDDASTLQDILGSAADSISSIGNSVGRLEEPIKDINKLFTDVKEECIGLENFPYIGPGVQPVCKPIRLSLDQVINALDSTTKRMNKVRGGIDGVTHPISTVQVYTTRFVFFFGYRCIS